MGFQANYLARQYDEAEEFFSHVLQLDPYRLEHIDIYSNILFVKEKDAELSNLAHNAAKWDKFRPETCCIIGNYYSRKAHHEKAIEYFSRALKLDPHYLSACTLMVCHCGNNATVGLCLIASDVGPRIFGNAECARGN